MGAGGVESGEEDQRRGGLEEQDRSQRAGEVDRERRVGADAQGGKDQECRDHMREPRLEGRGHPREGHAEQEADDQAPAAVVGDEG